MIANSRLAELPVNDDLVKPGIIFLVKQTTGGFIFDHIFLVHFPGIGQLYGCRITSAVNYPEG